MTGPTWTGPSFSETEVEVPHVAVPTFRVRIIAKGSDPAPVPIYDRMSKLDLSAQVDEHQHTIKSDRPPKPAKPARK